MGGGGCGEEVQRRVPRLCSVVHRTSENGIVIWCPSWLDLFYDLLCRGGGREVAVRERLGQEEEEEEGAG